MDYSVVVKGPNRDGRTFAYHDPLSVYRSQNEVAGWWLARRNGLFFFPAPESRRRAQIRLRPTVWRNKAVCRPATAPLKIIVAVFLRATDPH